MILGEAPRLGCTRHRPERRIKGLIMTRKEKDECKLEFRSDGRRIPSLHNQISHESATQLEDNLHHNPGQYPPNTHQNELPKLAAIVEVTTKVMVKLLAEIEWPWFRHSACSHPRPSSMYIISRIDSSMAVSSFMLSTQNYPFSLRQCYAQVTFLIPNASGPASGNLRSAWGTRSSGSCSIYR